MVNTRPLKKSMALLMDGLSCNPWLDHKARDFYITMVVIQHPEISPARLETCSDTMAAKLYQLRSLPKMAARLRASY
jgi:hypothetical protein